MVELQHINIKDNVEVMMRVLVIPLAFILLVSGVMAIEDLGTFKQNTCVGLKQTCDNCTYVNVSAVESPDTTITALNKVMTKTNILYNYTWCDTDQLGEYKVYTFGDLNGLTTSGSYTFTITTTGTPKGSTLSMTLILLVAALLLMLIAIFAKNEWIGFISGSLFIVGGIYTMIYGLGNMADLYTRAIGFSSIGFGIMLAVAAGYKVAEEGFGGFSSSEEDDD